MGAGGSIPQLPCPLGGMTLRCVSYAVPQRFPVGVSTMCPPVSICLIKHPFRAAFPSLPFILIPQLLCTGITSKTTYTGIPVSGSSSGQTKTKTTCANTDDAQTQVFFPQSLYWRFVAGRVTGAGFLLELLEALLAVLGFTF